MFNSIFVAVFILSSSAWGSPLYPQDGSSEDDIEKVEYVLEERGSLHTADYRIYYKGPNGYISPWHDIPLYADKKQRICNMVVEIPKFTNEKMEMCTKEPMSPIKQDVKNGRLRYVDNIFPYHGYSWNYGALPQTWENATNMDSDTGARGDNDPIDIIDIGRKVHKRGAIIQVKILGVLALIDSGETDWKLVAIDISDPLADDLKDIDDVDEAFPGFLKGTRKWFQRYKVPSGNPPNTFGFDGEFQDDKFAREKIEETHKFWKKLITEANPKLNTETNQRGAAHPASQEQWRRVVQSRPQYMPPSDRPIDVDQFKFVKI